MSQRKARLERRRKGLSVSRCKARRYMIVRVNDRTGARIDMLRTLVTHREACTVLSKMMNLRRWPQLRNVLEERS